MYRDILKLPVETPKILFFAPANIQTIKAFMNKVGYQRVVDKVIAFYTKNLSQPWQTMFKKKEVIQYPYFVKLIIADLMKKFPNIPKRLEEDYHSIMDDVSLGSVYTTGNEYETVFMKVDVLMEQSQPVVSMQGTHRRTPRAIRSPTISASPQERKKRKQIAKESKAEAKENIAKVQEKLDEEEIEKMIEGEKDKESYASAFANSVFNDDVDDTGRRCKDCERKTVDENVEKMDKVVKEKEVVDDVLGSHELRKEQMHTPIPLPTRSPRNVSSSEKTIFKELTSTVSPTIATTSKDSSTTKHKKRSFSNKTKI
nr:hypothetical protein [Tanacetum cinerariifolium]